MKGSTKIQGKKDFLPPLLLAAFCVYLFRDIVLGGHMLFGSDFDAFYLGMKQFLCTEVHAHGSIPLWNPYIFGGMPFWAHFESTIFYPLGFLFWLIHPGKAYGYTLFLHLALGALFMYLLARSLGQGRAGGFVAGAVFICSGYVMAILYLGQMCPIQSLVWLPLLILFLKRALTAKRPWFNACAGGFFWGVQILAGAPQDAFYAFLACALFLAWYGGKGRGLKHGPARAAEVLFVLFLVGAGVASVQLVPAFELIGESVRSSLDAYEMVTQGSYPPEGLITMIMPGFFGDYVNNTYWVGNVPWSIPQQNLYVGALSLVLFLFLPFREEAGKRVLLFAGTLALLALLLALGRHTPIYKWVWLLPGFDRFRAPSKIMVLWVFAAGLLAGQGMDTLLREETGAFSKRILLLMGLVVALVGLDICFHLEKTLTLKVFSPLVMEEALVHRLKDAAGIIAAEFHRFTLLCAFAALLIGFRIRGKLGPRTAGILLCALLVFDLAWVNGPSIQSNDAFYRTTGEIKRGLEETMGKDSGPFRVGGFQSELGPNIEMVLGYQSVGGFTALFLDRYYTYINRYTEGQLPAGWQYFFYGRHGNARLMDLLNVKYEIAYQKRKYYPRPDYFPRAFVVADCRVVARKEVLDILASPDFDPYRTVLFEREEAPPDLTPGGFREPLRAWSTEILSYRPDRIELRAASSRPAYLVLSEVFYPGWKAFVDDRPARILRGDHLFRVLEFPEGSHRVC
ncbi:MAG: YfhO family protein, partial [Deltaproteobacteria bacterium]|nr:YfhO family protein [Deltaproteobacteria bacterium]